MDRVDLPPTHEEALALAAQRLKHLQGAVELLYNTMPVMHAAGGHAPAHSDADGAIATWYRATNVFLDHLGAHRYMVIRAGQGVDPGTLGRYEGLWLHHSGNPNQRVTLGARPDHMGHTIAHRTDRYEIRPEDGVIAQVYEVRA